MKKQMKKLVLNRETLSGLDESLEKVAGGYTLKACTFSGYDTCQTCQATCGTNYC